MQIRISKFGKLNVLASLIIMHIKTFKKFIILLVFKKTSLILYNPKIVLLKICPANNQMSLF